MRFRSWVLRLSLVLKRDGPPDGFFKNKFGLGPVSWYFGGPDVIKKKEGQSPHVSSIGQPKQ